MSADAVVLALHAYRSEIWDSQYAGLRRYCLPRGWDVMDCCFPSVPDFDRVRRLLKGGKIIGIVTSLPVPLPKDILSKQPVVCFDCEVSGLMEGCPDVRHDAAYTAHLAARELSSLSIRNFAYVHAASALYWSHARCAAFKREIAARGGVLSSVFSMHGVCDRRRLVPALSRWVSDLPKPCGIFAANDETAEPLLSACARVGIQIPKDVAVIGVDDNQLVCTTVSPSLSSIAPDWEAGAFISALILDRLLKGRTVGMRHTFRPLGVIGRESTSRTSEVVNARVVKAVDAIRFRACEGLKARDVVEIMGCSRRLAELRFREVTGKSILEEIRRVRYENARLLLSQTDVPMDVVANRSGWASLPSFCREFKELTGLTPAEWRRKSSSEA